MYCLLLSFIPEEDPTFLYFYFLLVRGVVITFSLTNFVSQYSPTLYSRTCSVLCVSEHSYPMAIFPPTCEL